MAAKTWRLVVTELGGSSALHEVTVEAANWMTALKAGRAEIGESGGVPTGASCAVAPDGKVTIHDPMARRTYVLTPDVSQSLTRTKKPTGPRIPADEGTPNPARKREDVQDSPQASAALPGGVRAEGAGGPRTSAKVSKKTIAYAVSPVAAQAQQVPVGGPAAAAQTAAPSQPQAAQKEAPAPTPQAAPAASGEAPAKPQAAPQPAAQPQRAAQPQPASQPARPAPAPAAAQPQPAAPASPAAAPSTEWQLLSERSEDPSPESPLHYRERTFVVAEGTSKELAERIARERLAALQGELSDRPPGKFFNLAVFDHAWEGRPKRPPIVALQWKDWRGDPEVSYPLAAKQKAREARKQQAPAPVAAPAPPSQPPAAAAPAPAAPAPAPAPAPSRSQRPPAKRRTITDEQDARLAQAFEAAQDLFFLSTPAEGLDFAIRLLEDLVPCEAATACLYDINTDEFRFVALSGPGGEERRGEAIPARTGLLGSAAERVGAATIVPDVPRDERFDPGVDGRVGLEPRNALYLALHHQNRLLGMLQLINRRNDAGFTEADTEVVGYVGKQLAEFLYQARIAPDQGARI